MLFREYLKESGISGTRVMDLYNGFRAVHSAICQLDDDNLEILKDIGLNELLRRFGHHEDMKVVDLERGE